MKLPYAILVSLLLAAPVFAADGGGTPSFKIKKCRDANGEWHYGDNASQACANSPITVLNEQGVTVKKIAAPPTPAELKARAEQAKIAEHEKHLAEQQALHDKELLATYASESEITAQRDRRLHEIDTIIGAAAATAQTLKATLARMEAQAADEQRHGAIKPDTTRNIARTKEQIARQETLIQDQQKEQAALRVRYAADLKRYRELTSASIKVSDPATP